MIKINFAYFFWLEKLYMLQMNSYVCLILQIFNCRTLCKISEVNWLKIGGAVRVTKIDDYSFLRKPGKKITGSI